MSSDLTQKAETTTPAFQMKGGLFTLTSLQLLSTQLDIFNKQLEIKIHQAPKFFNHAPVVIDLQKINRPGTLIDFKQLKQILLSNQLVPVGIKGANPDQQTAAIGAGLAVLQDGHSQSKEPDSKTDSKGDSKPKEQDNSKSESAEAENKQNKEPYIEQRISHSKIITEPVRSGQQIYARDADLIVLGSVSHGSELLADGHIHVYGPLRGRALAGVSGDTKAHIFCQSLEAELISIAGHYKMSEDIEQVAWRIAVDISLEGGRLNFCPL